MTTLPVHIVDDERICRGGLIRLLAGGESGLLRETMNSLEVRLPPAQLVRIHRALLVNASRIREISSLGGGEYELLIGHQLLKSSRWYQRAVTKLFRKWTGGNLTTYLTTHAGWQECFDDQATVIGTDAT